MTSAGRLVAQWVILPATCACAGYLLAATAAPDRSEVLKARADRQEAQWIANERKEQLDESGVQYSALMKEFGDFQNEHDCRPKK